MTDPDEPGRYLYDALRDLGVLTNGWGPWDSLTPEMQGDLGRVAARLMPEQLPAPVAAVEHQHEWDCAACRHDSLILYCRRCPAIRQERL